MVRNCIKHFLFNFLYFSRYKDGVELKSSPNFKINKDVTGKHALLLNKAIKNHEGVYTVYAKNKAGQCTSEGALIIVPKQGGSYCYYFNFIKK